MSRFRAGGMLVVVVAAVAATGVLCGCRDSDDVRDPASLIPGWRTYANPAVGIRFDYPYTLALAVDSEVEPGQLALELQWVGRQSAVVSLRTFPAEMEAMVRKGEVAGTAAPATVGGVRGARLEVAGDPDAPPLQRVVVTSGGRVFAFTGEGETFDKVLATVEFGGQP